MSSLSIERRIDNLIIDTRIALQKGCQTPFKRIERKFDFQTSRYAQISQQNIVCKKNSLKLLLRLIQLTLVVKDLISKNQIVTKRNLYYKKMEYYKEHYQLLDHDLEILCWSLSINRKGLNIIASGRSILRGNIKLRIDQGQDSIVEGRCKDKGFLTLPVARDLEPIEIGFKNILIIEKESIFFELQQKIVYGSQQKQKYFEEFLCVTGKGYPDSRLRELLQSITQKYKIQAIYYIGDEDIYGFDILTEYAIGTLSYCGLLDNIRWLRFGKLEQDGLLDPQILKKVEIKIKEEDTKKALGILKRDYMQQEKVKELVPKTESQKLVKKRLNRWREEFVRLMNRKTKIELEGYLQAVITQNWLQKMIDSEYYL